MAGFNVTCYVDEESIETKVKNGIIRELRDSLKSEIEGFVRDEIKKYLKKVDIERIVDNELRKTTKEEVSELVYKIRRNEFEKFYWNAREVEPTPERMYKLLTSYVGYIDLLSDEHFKEAVSYKVTDEIIKKLGKNHGYKKIVDAVESSLEERVKANE